MQRVNSSIDVTSDSLRGCQQRSARTITCDSSANYMHGFGDHDAVGQDFKSRRRDHLLKMMSVL